MPTFSRLSCWLLHLSWICSSNSSSIEQNSTETAAGYHVSPSTTPIHHSTRQEQKTSPLPQTQKTGRKGQESRCHTLVSKCVRGGVHWAHVH
ncbi:hypothetical protein BX070DRAFT_70552 [Coemansia spiralis]|nr:hypothetical protein BX070DRAFT_70552 [Coemansia spiralis]